MGPEKDKRASPLFFSLAAGSLLAARKKRQRCHGQEMPLLRFAKPYSLKIPKYTLPKPEFNQQMQMGRSARVTGRGSGTLENVQGLEGATSA